MAFWNKSKYKKKETFWFDDPNYNAYEASRGWDSGYGGHSGYTPASDYGGYSGYTASWYKPKYDMGMSLETRVTQLIKTITGKNVKLVQAKGWGSDDEHFYYNPKDLEQATDDEVLGRILQQLGKDLYQDKKAMAVVKNSDPQYKSLLDALEANRNDYQLAQRYGGTKYYARELWDVRKLADNPLAKQSKRPSHETWMSDVIAHPFHQYAGNKNAYDNAYKNYLEENYPNIDNPPWEFCFNIHAMQNGESEFDFSHDNVAANFTKAMPYINDYLTAATFSEALAMYQKVKPYYPLPNGQQQDEMDSEMGATQGLSEEEKKSLAKATAAARSSGGSNSDEPDHFMKVFEPDYKIQHWKGEARNRAIYQKYLNKYMPTVNVLTALIRSILQDNAIKRFDRPFKRGKLDAKRMYKFLATGNTRIFKKQRAISQQKYVMAIVVDMSGSMGGDNAKYATQAAIVLANVMERLNFPYEILAYNGGVYTVKGFKQPLRPEVLPVLEHAGGDNNESATLDKLNKHIAAYDGGKESKKSIFWITDGQANRADYVKKRTTQLEREHNATIFAVGIGDSINTHDLARCYNSYLKVDELTELPKKLVALMKSQFRRR